MSGKFFRVHETPFTSFCSRPRPNAQACQDACGLGNYRSILFGVTKFRLGRGQASSCQQDDVTWWLIQLNKSKRDIVQSASDGMWHAARWNAADCCRSYQVLDLSSFPYYSYLRNTKYLSWETPAETIAISKRITKNKNNGITITHTSFRKFQNQFRLP